jgi:hypothetical protein
MPALLAARSLHVQLAGEHIEYVEQIFGIPALLAASHKVAQICGMPALLAARSLHVQLAGEHIEYVEQIFGMPALLAASSIHLQHTREAYIYIEY